MNLRKIALFGILFAAVLISIGCNMEASNMEARRLGGNVEMTLPANQKLVEVTWKDNSLWYLTRPMKDTEKPESYTFKESSQWGVMEGTVTIYETR